MAGIVKKISILGSTGNIGTQTLEVADKYPDKIKVVGLATKNDIGLLEEQIRKYNPLAVGVADQEKADELKKRVDTKIYSGQDSLLKIAGLAESDTIVNAVSGLNGIRATLEGIKRGKDIALANKETLVAAGEIIMQGVKKNNVKLMPIDSEHSAIWQCLNKENKSAVSKIILTCSGGALYDKTKQELENATKEQALGHKTWKMGEKITIDSATLMNKGFEVIEAMWLYDISLDKIEVIIHPQSIIHSMVEYSDASIIAQLANPDMKLPIQYALSYPERWGSVVPRLDFPKDLSFDRPDLERFPCLAYAYKAAEQGGTLPAAMNAANDFMVNKFLQKKCRFSDIPDIIKKVMDFHKKVKNPTLKDIEIAIKESEEMAEEYFNAKLGPT
ncbi:1-deoxy-D-xylulose-5-phosphate reductoisomerase [Patescibacteria group bacterium]|nr:1-deoxy-D-xylulose-5-phosphate reductoisomerase [Patescibacteria group bacterium]